jgi:hypothetical protein
MYTNIIKTKLSGSDFVTVVSILVLVLPPPPTSRAHVYKWWD